MCLFFFFLQINAFPSLLLIIPRSQSAPVTPSRGFECGEAAWDLGSAWDQDRPAVMLCCCVGGWPPPPSFRNRPRSHSLDIIITSTLLEESEPVPVTLG